LLLLLLLLPLSVSASASSSAAAALALALVAPALLGHRGELRRQGRAHPVRPSLEHRGDLLLLLLLLLLEIASPSGSGGRARGQRRQRRHRAHRPQRREHAARLRAREQQVRRRPADPGQRLDACAGPLLAAHLGTDGLEVGVLEQRARAGARGAGRDADGDELCELARGHAREARGADSQGHLAVDLGGVAALGVGVLERGELLLLGLFF